MIRTKHFLITSSDGEQIAVISAKTNEQFLGKLTLALREQLGYPEAEIDPACVDFNDYLYSNDKVPYVFDKNFREHDVVWARCIELY